MNKFVQSVQIFPSAVNLINNWKFQSQARSSIDPFSTDFCCCLVVSPFFFGTYLESDNELPTCYSLLTEQQLLEAIGTSHDVMEIESDDENEMEKEDTPGEGERSNEKTTLKSFKDVLDSVQNISAFLIHRGV